MSRGIDFQRFFSSSLTMWWDLKITEHAWRWDFASKTCIATMNVMEFEFCLTDFKCIKLNVANNISNLICIQLATISLSFVSIVSAYSFKSTYEIRYALIVFNTGISNVVYFAIFSSNNLLIVQVPLPKPVPTFGCFVIYSLCIKPARRIISRVNNVHHYGY